jgi:hypothetical protein
MAKPTARWGSLPFAEQIAFFKDKTNLPTERWQDLLGAAHDRAFVVAGAMKADLLADLHAAALKGIEQGTTLETFREDFQAIVAKRGWTGWTGEDSPEGVAWRTKTIYGTNLRTSYQAGRHAQAQAIAHRRPFWRYVHNATVMDPRPEHLAWHGTVLRADNPWWDKHFVPNGWGCRCRIETLSQRDLDRLGKSGPDPTPDDGTYEWLDKRTGQTHTIPKGIDPGWDYTPGATRDLIAEVKAKAAGLPPQLGEALAADVAAIVTPPIDAAAQAARDDCLAWGRVNNRERLILLDEKTGKELTRADGDERSVSFNREILDIVNDDAQAVRLIHNHPSDSSLSNQDFQAILNPGVVGIEAIGHNGSHYIALQPLGGKVNETVLMRALAKSDEAIRREIQPSFSAMRLPIDIANWAHGYFLAKGLAEAGLIRYEAILNSAKLAQLEPYQWIAERCIAAAKRAAEGAK